MKKFIDTLLIIMIILTGLSLFLYPTVSNYLSEQNGSQAINRYTGQVSVLDEGAGEAELARAERYNEALYRSSIDAEPTSVSQSDYEYMLNLSGDGMIGYIDIPRIGVRLPICHGTDGKTLESCVGHMPSSSLPVGGESTHCVLTGHTGMPSAKLLTDLNHMQTGDRFTVTTLNRCLTYEVESVTVVVPDETESLRIRRGEDLCTLVTCTPYGLNTHRLLVTGHRVAESEPEEVSLRESFADALLNDPIMMAFAALLVMLMLTYAVTKIGIKRDQEKI